MAEGPRKKSPVEEVSVNEWRGGYSEYAEIQHMWEDKVKEASRGILDRALKREVDISNFDWEKFSVAMGVYARRYKEGRVLSPYSATVEDVKGIIKLMKNS